MIRNNTEKDVIAIIGDYSGKMYTHTAIEQCIEHCRPHIPALEFKWINTNTLDNSSLDQYLSFWIAPGSPYENDDAVYSLLRTARENKLKVYGMCGGFQYMVVEYARNVLGIGEAGHEESDPAGNDLVISKMSCSKKGVTEEVIVSERNSWLHTVLKTDRFSADFNCSYGINKKYQSMLDVYPFVITAFSPLGEPRAFELRTHPFYKGTLFQPQLHSSYEHPNPLILNFIRGSMNSD